MLIAPDMENRTGRDGRNLGPQPGVSYAGGDRLATVPEIRAITDMHRVHVLNGTVTSQDIYAAVRNEQRDVIHFASHSDEHGVMLSGGELLEPDDIVQIARLSRVRLVFFNSCLSAHLAAYAVGHGVPYAIASTVELLDRDAWKTALAFYQYCQEQMRSMGKDADPASVDIPGAFQAAANGDGTYMLLRAVSAPSQMATIIKRLDQIDAKLRLQWVWIVSGIVSWVAIALSLIWLWQMLGRHMLVL